MFKTLGAFYKPWQLSYSFAKVKDITPIVKQDNIRNFCIIAHIDHGKSTLADRLLELTGAIPKLEDKSDQQYLDKLQVEKERGITVKAQTASMFYDFEGEKYLLNLVDTPGHIDFNYEVSRSMRSCGGALLVVDSTQGIQAQTISNFDLAFEAGLEIIPVLNKIDMPAASVESVTREIENQFDMYEQDLASVSAKTGLGVPDLLPRIVQKFPSPEGDLKGNLRAFVVDSWYVKDRGVITLFLVKDGYIEKGDKIVSTGFGKKYDVFEVGILSPEMKPQQYLTTGQIGYVITNMKAAQESRIGDTFHRENKKVEPIPGFQPAKQMIFAGIYPEDPNDFLELEKAIHKLQLTDPAVSIIRESSAALGNGFRCGFLGLLHMDVFKQRLDDEYELSTILTMPSVPYKCKLRNGKIKVVENAIEAPDAGQVKEWEEPMVETSIIVPADDFTDVMVMCQEKRGEEVEIRSLDQTKYSMKYLLPMSEVITDFFDKIKSMTKGYGSLDFEFKGYRPAKIKKMTIMLMGDPVDALSFMVHESKAHDFGKLMCKRLKEKIPRQLFPVVIQAAVGSRVVAKEEIPMMKKNVIAKCYGGDYTRKKKLIDKQKSGKKHLRKIGKVEVSKETFVGILKS